MAIPANNKKGTLADIEHIVFMMQENRSFDHYLGSLNGVRGFSDPRAVRLHGGNSVFYQPVVAGAPAPYVLPYHPTAKNLGLQFIEDLEHDWDTTHVAWNVGNWDQWVPAKSPLTMVYLNRSDIPYQYALADAFTVCDAYHASFNPEVWSKTVLFVMYDENDGFFDHMVPPTPPQSAAQGLSTVPITNEIYPWSSRMRVHRPPQCRLIMSIAA